MVILFAVPQTPSPLKTYHGKVQGKGCYIAASGCLGVGEVLGHLALLQRYGISEVPGPRDPKP